MAMQYWEILLSNWRAIGRDGFSIPYIIGSQQYLTNNKNQNIQELFIDIISNSNQEIYLSYCMNINDLILGIRDDSKKRIKGFFPKFNGQSQNAFYLTDFVRDLGTDLADIIENLADKYSEQIEKKQFSINNRIRGDYSESEINFIKGCFE
tara:strand:+ start:1106 stop:1558 length:453 start_codon:yes stop_codon:yes gene_type:complete